MKNFINWLTGAPPDEKDSAKEQVEETCENESMAKNNNDEERGRVRVERRQSSIRFTTNWPPHAETQAHPRRDSFVDLDPNAGQRSLSLLSIQKSIASGIHETSRRRSLELGPTSNPENTHIGSSRRRLSVGSSRQLLTHQNRRLSIEHATANRRLSLESIFVSWEGSQPNVEEQEGPLSNVDPSQIKNTSPLGLSITTASDNSSIEDIENQETFEDDKMVEDWQPNTQHPSLEYPPLYFFLKRFPKLQNQVRKLYTLRWEVSYPLQMHVPLTKYLRKIGIVITWGELLLFLPFIIILSQGMITSFVNPSVSKSGMVARLPLAICFLTANRNSLLTLLLGIPFERALRYHKISGYVAFINGIFHTYVAFVLDEKKNGNGAEDIVDFAVQNQINSAGTILMTIIVAMLITSLPIVRRVLFEVFYYFHILFAISMMACAFYHSGIFVPILASLLWGGDLLIRKIVMACVKYPRKASIVRITDTVIELSIPKTKVDYNSGQYFYIAIPELSIFQWHPFSVSSSPHQNTITFHIRKSGNWTSRLYNLAGEKREVSILMEGPYGSCGVDLDSDRYKMVLFLSGGIGVTPMQSMCHQLLYEYEWHERELKKLWFIWTARDPEVMENMDVTNRSSNNVVIENTNMIGGGPPQSTASGINTPSIAEKMLTEFPVSYTPDEELERELPIEDFEGVEEEEEDLSVQSTQSSGHSAEGGDEEGQWQGNTNTKSFQDVDIDSLDEDILKLDCYLTAREMEDAGISSMPFVNQGRPDMKSIFLMMRAEAIRQGETRIAVCVCAPKRLVQICQKACIKFSNKLVKFDLHSETF